MPSLSNSRPWIVVLFASLSAACGGGGGGGGGTGSGIDVPQGTVALGDTGLADLSELSITFHELAVSGGGTTSYIVEEGVDAAVTVDALAYQDTAAPIAKKGIAAGDYDTLSFKVTITAKDLALGDVPVYPLFDPQGSTYTAVETTFPLGPNSFTVAEPAEDNQPFLFLHIDVSSSVRDGEIAGSILVGPQIFLATRVFMHLDGTVTKIDADGGVFALEDAEGTEFVVQPTDCTSFVGGFTDTEAGVGPAVVFANIAVGDSLGMDGVLGVDPGCADPDQKDVFFHPQFCRAQFDASGITLVHGVVQSVDTSGGSPVVTLLVIGSSDVGAPPGPGGPPPGAIAAGELFSADFTDALVYTGFGEVQDLSGAADRLQVGESIGIGVLNVSEVLPGEFTGDPQVGFLQPSQIAGMLKDVTATTLSVWGSKTKKGSGSGSHDGQAWMPGIVPPGNPVPTVAFGADTDFTTDAGSVIKVGPLTGWRLTQVVDPYFDNQLEGPAGGDGQNLPPGCYDDATADVDIDIARLTAFVDHQAGGANVWTIERLDVTVFGDVTQKYVAWYSGTPSCSQPANGAWQNQPCIAIDNMHREHIDLDSGASSTSYGQSGAGAFGTSILNAGALVPGATIPAGSDTAGWDDVNEYVLLGIDFDGDMCPFDDTDESCVDMSERVWVDISQAQFFYFAVDPITQAVDMQYLNTYADFKANVIALQAAQQGNSCGMGFHENAGFGFTGLIDKESLTPDGFGDVVPVIRAIDGRVFNGGCVPDVN